MVYYGEFINKKDGEILMKLFEDENTKLLDLLDDYSKHNNYLSLKNSIYEMLETVPEF